MTTRRSPREAILEAAQRLFAERGIDAVSTAELCRAAGTSNGSMFHFFPTKDVLVGTLYLRALQSYQHMVLAGLERSPSARAGTRGFVLRHVRWVTENPDLALMIHQQRHAAAGQAIEDEIQALNRAFTQRMVSWLEPHVKAGTMRALAPHVFLAVVFGPVHMLTRDPLRTRDYRPLRAAARALADSAWAAVAAPEPKRGTPPPQRTSKGARGAKARRRQ